MNHYERLRHLVVSLEDDLLKFYEKGNRAAGTRARGSMQEVRMLAQDIRKDIQNIKNSSNKDKSSSSKKK